MAIYTYEVDHGEASPRVGGRMDVSHIEPGKVMAVSFTDTLSQMADEEHGVTDFTRVTCWAEDRNIIDGCTWKDQLAKLMEEIGEFCEAQNKGRHDEAELEMGDILVVMTIMAAQTGIDQPEEQPVTQNN